MAMSDQTTAGRPNLVYEPRVGKHATGGVEHLGDGRWRRGSDRPLIGNADQVVVVTVQG